MSSRSKISALASLYIRETPGFLDQALESVYNQTLQADEIVLVLDGPITDELKKVIDHWKPILPIREVPLTENVGLGRALNIGLSQCTNEVVARFDTDDVNYSERFEQQYGRLQANAEIAAVSASIREFGSVPGDMDVVRAGVGDDDAILRYAKYRNPLNHASVMFRKSAVLAAGGYQDLPLMEDYYLWLRMLAKGLKLTSIREVLVDVRIGNGMYERRKGLSYIHSEILLFRIKNKLQITNLYEGIYILALRVIPRMLPSALLPLVYSRLRAKGKPN